MCKNAEFRVPPGSVRKLSRVPTEASNDTVVLSMVAVEPAPAALPHLFHVGAKPVLVKLMVTLGHDVTPGLITLALAVAPASKNTVKIPLIYCNAQSSDDVSGIVKCMFVVARSIGG